MTDGSLAELHAGARQAYTTWPLWLCLQRKRVAAHLHTGEYVAVSEADELTLLRSAALPLPDDPQPPQDFQRLALGQGACAFESLSERDTQLLAFRCDDQRCVLLRVLARDAWYIDGTAPRLNHLLTLQPAEAVFNAARLWAAYHGCHVADLIWQPVVRSDTAAETHENPSDAVPATHETESEDETILPESVAQPTTVTTTVVPAVLGEWD